jgi:uncharacterized membrane protein
MPELLRHVFGWVCGQNPAHTWSPGGELLPLCQRCTGVYVGAFAAALLHLAWRPAPTPRWLWLNGAFLLFMMPSGFYWIPQNPELRCASGILFGFGLVAFLWLTLPENHFRSDRGNEAQNSTGYRPSAIGNESGSPHIGFYKIFAACPLAVLVLTPLLAEYGNGVAAGILMAACVAGALALAALLLANIFCLLHWLFRRCSHPTA